MRTHLDTREIEARPVWKPMHLQPVFRHCAVRGGRVAEALFSDGLCLPSGSSLTNEQQDRVICSIHEAAAQHASAARRLAGVRS